jgi:exodeoxyribonuclease VII large subunit
MNGPVAGPARRVLSVSQLVSVSRDLLAEAMPFVWVRGEVSGFAAASSGHWYFDLKDQQALVPVAMFSRANSAVPFRVEEGMELIVGGEVTIYPLKGKFQVVAEILEPAGWGARQVAYEQLLQRLAGEGLFDPARKRPLPLLPRCVGVVTSASGAAWRDMCRVWRDNQVPIRVILAPAQVQGSGAAAQIEAAIARLNRHAAADVLIVGRGGGSREDLWAFNEEVTARAIASSAIPVVAAVGHEIDQTIADLVADHRAATPTAAAELVAARRQTLLSRLHGAEGRARGALRHRLLVSRNRLAEPRLQRYLMHPARLLAVYRQRLDEALERLATPLNRCLGRDRRRLEACSRALAARSLAALAQQRRARLRAGLTAAQGAAGRLLERRRSRLLAAAARIEALSPLAVLGRGYAICERQRDGRIVRAADDVEAGEKVRVRLLRDTLGCTVESAEKGAERPAL